MYLQENKPAGAGTYQWSPWGSQPVDSVGEGARLWARAAWSMPRATKVEVSFILTCLMVVDGY